MHTIRFIFISLLIAAFNLTSYGVTCAVTIDIPEKKLIDVMNADIEYILALTFGKDLENKPGPRIRDGALACAALLKMGISEPVKEWLDSVTFEDGAGWGGQVEYVFAVRNYIDYSGDKAYLQAAYPKVVKILEFTRGMRRENMGRSHCDDFFALGGFKDGAYLANLMGRKEDAGWMQKEADDLRKSIYDSINKSGFDPASTAVAIIAAGELEHMPKDILRNAFDRYFAEFSEGLISAQNRGPGPYEMYSADACLRLDQRDRGLTILRYFAENPAGSAAGYIDAVRTIFVYEDAGKLILGQGLAPEWFDQGIEVKDMPTLYGKICYVIKKEGNVIRYFIYGTAKPPKGVKFVLPRELSGCKIEEMKAKQ